MLVSVQSADRLNVVALPDVVGGAHWICDALGARLAFVEGVGNLWRIQPAEGFEIVGPGDDSPGSVEIAPGGLAVLNMRAGATRESFCLVFQHADSSVLGTVSYGFAGDVRITVGRSSDNDIVYDNGFVSSRHVNLLFRHGAWSVGDPGSTNGVFLNGRRLSGGERAAAGFGDVVSLLGFRITLGNGFFSCNNPDACVTVRPDRFVRYNAPSVDATQWSGPPKRALFYPALRFARTVEKRTFTIDAPPPQEAEERTSLLQRVGPSMLMGFASLMSACVFIMLMGDTSSSMLRAVPMVFMAVSMLAASVVWPIMNARHQQADRVQREAVRRGAYSQYLSSVLSEISREEALQREILEENRISVQDCLAMASAADVHLMDRTTLHADFLEVRVGTGDEPFVADVKFPDFRFSTEDDELRKEVALQAAKPRILHDAPLAFPLVEKHVAGVVGPDSEVDAFVRGIVVQVAALCSYEDVKVVVLVDEERREAWSFARHLPHCFADDRSMRYFACGLEEVGEIGMFLERVIAERTSEDRFDGREAHPYYVVVCASETLVETANVVEAIATQRENVGMSLIAVAHAMKDLPKECRSVIGVGAQGSYLLDRDDPSGNRRPFKADIAVSADQAAKFSFDMSKLRLDLSVEKRQIPARLGFLEMYGAGNVEHLNIGSRWRDNSASTSLACCVGVDVSGEPFLLNLHEKAHGPHGLIAGTTGSGKSEFIISYVLSMAMTYSPEDIAFVLIDYKGGGLARAFDNEHVRLPHLAGVITNLDGAAIKRSLVSIQSELKRRQALFNEARDVVGGDNVDIYDYLDLYRQGRMSEPCPHLFIVADEFAELKQQEPDFMDELISAARIGRSLGVHLVLATQKPSGVVNDQIWSNARFKVCLKVADAGDSKEMIRRPDAAELQEPGRFYLLVGYNEYFALGQAAYAGSRYIARERFEKARDDSVVLISDTGSPLVTVKARQAEMAGEAKPESVVLIAAVQQAAQRLGVQARQLWLEPVPALVYVDALAAKYGRAFGQPQRDFTLNAIVGEYDDPAHQRQGLLTLPLSEAGNAIIYGTAESGVETALYSIVYSLVRAHDAASLNLYLVDFGSESLRAFADAPQVGDVIGVSDDEKLARFLGFFEAELSRRRALLAEYGGSFARYADSHDDKPAIVVVFNDLPALIEACPHLEDGLMRFMRDTGRNGVHVVATAQGTTSVRMKIRQSFRQVLAVNLADTTDYAVMFGPLRDLPAPRGFGRGIAQLEDGIFEFQAAHLSESGDDFGFAARFCAGLADARAGVAAPAIPVAPKVVSSESIAGAYDRNGFIPYGIYEDDLSIAGLDFSDALLARCHFQKKRDGAAFLGALLESLSGSAERAGWSVALLDMAQMLGDGGGFTCSFSAKNDDPAKTFLASFVLDGKPRTEADGRLLLVITGIMEFLNRSGFEFADRFKAFLRSLYDEAGVRVLLVDASSNASYAYEDWFKAHLTGKDGLWVGPGIESQSAIGITYNPARLKPDSEMDATRGYDVLGGQVRLVRLISRP